MDQKPMDDQTRMSLIDSILQYDPEAARTGVQRALERGYRPQQILDAGLLIGIEKIGREFGQGNIFLPELMLASKAMKAGVDYLKDFWKPMEEERKTCGRVALGTVKGDIHSIGKDLVASMLAASGFEVFDCGVDASERTFIEQVRNRKPDILGLSALLTTSMAQQEYVIRALQKAGLRDQVKVLIGGSPTTEEWGKKIGADGWAPNAGLAVDQSKKLMKS